MWTYSDDIKELIDTEHKMVALEYEKHGLYSDLHEKLEREPERFLATSKEMLPQIKKVIDKKLKLTDNRTALLLRIMDVNIECDDNQYRTKKRRELVS